LGLTTQASSQKEKGFSLVLEKASGGVFYFDQTLDITEEVINRYDELKKTKLGFPIVRPGPTSRNDRWREALPLRLTVFASCR